MLNVDPDGVGRVRSSWPSRMTNARGPVVRVRAPQEQMGWVSLAGGIEWLWLVTLTFDPKKVWRVSLQLAEKETIHWCGEIEHYFRRPVGWMAAFERHKSGRWHSHVLLADVPEPVTLFAEFWRGRNGRVDVQPVTNAAGAVLYLSKNAAANGDILLGDTSYFTARR